MSRPKPLLQGVSCSSGLLKAVVDNVEKQYCFTCVSCKALGALRLSQFKYGEALFTLLQYQDSFIDNIESYEIQNVTESN